MARKTTTRTPVMHAATILPRQEGEEERTVCLLCGQVWPCPDAPRTVHSVPMEPEPTPESVVATAIASNVPWNLVAARQGVPREEVQEYLDNIT